MSIKHKKEFGVYHWDTFDNAVILIADKDTLKEAEDLVATQYEGNLKPDGADQVDIVDSKGTIVKKYKVG
jgi:hypothetical protein